MHLILMAENTSDAQSAQSKLEEELRRDYVEYRLGTKDKPGNVGVAIQGKKENRVFKIKYNEDNRVITKPVGNFYIQNPVSHRLEQVTDAYDDGRVSYLESKGVDENKDDYERRAKLDDITSFFAKKPEVLEAERKKAGCADLNAD